MSLRRVTAPPPGQYVGKVQGCPAIIMVVPAVVYAWWLRPRDKVPHGNAWDIGGDGKFAPDSNGQQVSFSAVVPRRRK